MLLPLYVAAGIVPVVPRPKFGTIIAPEECTVAASRRQGTATVGNNIPLGAPEWQQHLDPSDEAPYAFDFRPLLLPGETIRSIRRLRMPPASWDLGVHILDGDRGPIIDETTKAIVQLWFAVNKGKQDAPGADGTGTQLPIGFWVRTSFYRSLERTAVLRERNQ